MLRSSSSLNSVLLKQIQADSSKPRTEIAGFKLIDFKQSVFDGEYRDTIRWIRYFEDTFKEKSIFYLFDPLHPVLVRPNSYYALREVEAAREMEQIQRFSIQQAAWEDIVDVVDWYHDREFIANMPAGAQKSAAELLNVADRAALIVAHPPPVREPFASMFTNIHVHAIKEYERLRDKEEVDAGSALGILKSKVGTKITTYLTSSWDNNAYSTINKARSTWDYISQFLRANIDAVMVAIDDDFTSIPMARTVPGARVNYIKMQRLREDCVRVGRDKTDVELVSKMRGKMTGPAFVKLNFTLRNLEHGQLVVPVLRMPGLPLPPVQAPRPAVTWAEFGRYLDTLGEESSSDPMTTIVQEGQESSSAVGLEALAAFEESKALAAEQFQIFGDASAFQAFQQSERNPRSILRSDSNQNRDRSRSRDSSSGRARFSDSPGNTPRFSRSPKQFGQPFVPAGQSSTSNGRPEWLASSRMNQFTQYANQQQQQQQQQPSSRQQ